MSRQASHLPLLTSSSQVTAWMPDKTDAKNIFTAAPWRTGGDQQDALVLCGWRLSSRAGNPITSHWMKQLTWLRIVHFGDWCLRLVLCKPREKRRLFVTDYSNSSTSISLQKLLSLCLQSQLSASSLQSTFNWWPSNNLPTDDRHDHTSSL